MRRQYGSQEPASYVNGETFMKSHAGEVYGFIEVSFFISKFKIRRNPQYGTEKVHTETRGAFL